MEKDVPKKFRKGISTSKSDIHLIEQRLKLAREDYETFKS